MFYTMFKDWYETGIGYWDSTIINIFVSPATEQIKLYYFFMQTYGIELIPYYEEKNKYTREYDLKRSHKRREANRLLMCAKITKQHPHLLLGKKYYFTKRKDFYKPWIKIKTKTD